MGHLLTKNVIKIRLYKIYAKTDLVLRRFNIWSTLSYVYRKWLLQRHIDCCLASSNGSNCSTSSVYEHFVNMDTIDINMDLAANHNQVADNNNHNSTQPDLNEVLRRELTICTNAAEKYPCNYNAWSHRSWVVQYCYNCTIQVIHTCMLGVMHLILYCIIPPKL